MKKLYPLLVSERDVSTTLDMTFFRIYKKNLDMSDQKKIKTALVSVFHKDGLDEIIKKLHAEGVTLLSTGGTQNFIEGLGIP